MLATLGSGSLTKGARIKAAVSWSGPMDFKLWPLSLLTLAPIGEAVLSFLNCPPEEATCANVAAASPITYVDKTDAPMLLANSDNELVGFDHATTMDAALKAVGVAEQLVVVPRQPPRAGVRRRHLAADGRVPREVRGQATGGEELSSACRASSTRRCRGHPRCPPSRSRSLAWARRRAPCPASAGRIRSPFQSPPGFLRYASGYVPPSWHSAPKARNEPSPSATHTDRALAGAVVGVRPLVQVGGRPEHRIAATAPAPSFRRPSPPRGRRMPRRRARRSPPATRLAATSRRRAIARSRPCSRWSHSLLIRRADRDEAGPGVVGDRLHTAGTARRERQCRHRPRASAVGRRPRQRTGTRGIARRGSDRATRHEPIVPERHARRPELPELPVGRHLRGVALACRACRARALRLRWRARRRATVG